MTEQDWAACDDVGPMLQFLDGKVPVRKLFLFDAACCRRIWRLIPPAGRWGLGIGEQFADSGSTLAELDQAFRDMLRESNKTGNGYGGNPYSHCCEAAVMGLLPHWAAAYHHEWGIAAHSVVLTTEQSLQSAERRAQIALLRHIVADPFVPLAMPASLPATVVAMASAVYDGAFALRDSSHSGTIREVGCDFGKIASQIQ